MNVTGKLALSFLAAAGTLLAIRHGADALHPAIPRDMPGSSYFVESAYNVSRNEWKGKWIACHADVAEGADYCRVTDVKGVVIYQGEFMPVNGPQAVPADQLRVASADDDKDLWVHGPAEDGPVPAIRLENGEILVPADDVAALADRWTKNPDEMARLEEK